MTNYFQKSWGILSYFLMCFNLRLEGYWYNFLWCIRFEQIELMYCMKNGKMVIKCIPSILMLNVTNVKSFDWLKYKISHHGNIKQMWISWFRWSWTQFFLIFAPTFDNWQFENTPWKNMNNLCSNFFGDDNLSLVIQKLSQILW